MQPKHAALVVLTCALLLAPAAYYATRTSSTPDATMPPEPVAPPGLLVQRTAHPHELQTTPLHTGNLTIVADDPTRGVLESWNATAGTPHVSNTTTWPHLIRLRAIPHEGPTLLRWVWIGNYTLTSSPDLPTLLKQVGETP